jgi:hypothetical protein
MYFPFITAKSLAGFGAPHSAFMRAFPRLQMILVLACDEADGTIASPSTKPAGRWLTTASSTKPSMD